MKKSFLSKILVVLTISTQCPIATPAAQSFLDQLKVIKTLQDRPEIIPVTKAPRGASLDALPLDKSLQDTIAFGTIDIVSDLKNNNNNYEVPSNLLLFVSVDVGKAPIAAKKYSNLNKESYPFTFKFLIKDLLMNSDEYYKSFASRSSLVITAIIDEDGKFSTTSSQDLVAFSFSDPKRMTGNFFGRDPVELIASLPKNKDATRKSNEKTIIIKNKIDEFLNM